MNPKLLYSPLTERIYVVTKYKILQDDHYEAIQKFDVTDEFKNIMKELITREENNKKEMSKK